MGLRYGGLFSGVLCCCYVWCESRFEKVRGEAKSVGSWIRFHGKRAGKPRISRIWRMGMGMWMGRRKGGRKRIDAGSREEKRAGRGQGEGGMEWKGRKKDERERGEAEGVGGMGF